MCAYVFIICESYWLSIEYSGASPQGQTLTTEEPQSTGRRRSFPSAEPIHAGRVHEPLGVRCKFFTKPKLSLTIKRPKKYPKGYPLKPQTLGEKIRKRRMDLGLFQKDVARMLGVATDTVTYWEKGRVKPSKKNLVKIQKFLSQQA